MCSRVLWNHNKLAVVVARTMDWPQSTEPVLTVFPRGMKRDGGRLKSKVIVNENPVTWVSKYASLITAGYEMGAADGFNEKGVAIHLLYLRADPKPATTSLRACYVAASRRTISARSGAGTGCAS